MTADPDKRPIYFFAHPPLRDSLQDGQGGMPAAPTLPPSALHWGGAVEPATWPGPLPVPPAYEGAP